MIYEPSYLECQTCGDRLRKLSPAEAQDVADNPYNYIRYCSTMCTLMDADPSLIDMEAVKREMERRGYRG